MAVKQSRTPTRRQSAKKIDFMKATENIGKPIATIAGFAVGKFALKKLAKGVAVSGLMGTDMKQYIVPAVVTMGGLIGTQFTRNQYIQLGLVGVAGAGVEAVIKKATGKTILQGLEGVLGDIDDADYDEGNPQLMAVNPIIQSLPMADIDIENEINDSISGANNFDISDDPIGDVSEEFSMSDDPIGCI